MDVICFSLSFSLDDHVKILTLASPMGLVPLCQVQLGVSLRHQQPTDAAQLRLYPDGVFQAAHHMSSTTTHVHVYHLV